MSTSRKKNIEAIYPLSPMQQGMLFHTIFDDREGQYFEQTTFKIHGDFKTDLFRSALEIAISRNPVLRTSIVYKKVEKSMQVVHKSVDLPVTELNWSKDDKATQSEKLEAYLKQDREQGFNLSKAPLLRLAMVRLDAQTWQLIWSNHHILFDGWSLPILLKEIFTFYEAGLKGLTINPPLKRPFRDYIAWLQKQDIAKAEKFWRKYMSGFSEPTFLPMVHTAAEDADIQYPKETVHLDKAIADRLAEIARRNQLTMSTLVQGAWGLLLSRLCDTADIAFGATVSGRPSELAGVEEMLGLFINTLPVRWRFDRQQTVLQMLSGLQKDAVEMREYEYSSLADIQRWSGIQTKQGLFDSIVVFENYPVDQSMNDQPGSLQFLDVQTLERTNYPVTLVVGAHHGLTLDIGYQAHILDQKDVLNMLNQLAFILQQFAADPNRTIGSVEILTPAGQQQKLTDWSGEQSKPNLTQPFHLAFEQQASKTPNALAVSDAGGNWTYSDLDSSANRLAGHLQQKFTLATEDRVAICLPRDRRMIQSVIGVLKTGAAYVPIDQNYPPERIAYILNDADVRLVITTKELMPLFSGQGIDLLLLEDVPTESDTFFTPRAVSEANLAYMIYTSGSTGKPKGTLVTHGGLTHYLNWCLKAYPLKEGHGTLVHSTLAFDATVTSLFPALLLGKTVTMLAAEGDLEALGKALKTNASFSLVKITPAHLELLRHQISEKEAAGLTSSFVIGGENLTVNQIEFWQKFAPQTRLYNEYGPTETVVGCVVFEAADWHGKGSVPIGKPIQNTNVYVLDSHLHPCPEGIPGELYIARPALARGYNNRADLTAAAFLPDPFSKIPGSRMYKTGDLVKDTGSGQLEFLRRTDTQVKIRGFRIEPGEIETLLLGNEAINEAVVIVREDVPGDKRLVAYFTCAESEPDLDAIRHNLQTSLPEYMVPSALVVIDELPLTANGKVDVKALPQPEQAGSVDSGGLQNPTEELMATLYKKILNVHSVGPHDSFFDLGGHSLLAMQLISRIREAFSIDLPLQTLFKHPSVRQLASDVADLRQDSQLTAIPRIVKRPPEADIPLSFSQQRLWFLDRLAPETANYNIPVVLRLKGELNMDVLNRALSEIIRRHEVLRTTFEEVKGDVYQIVHEAKPVNLAAEDLTPLKPTDAQSEARRIAKEELSRGFDLAEGPLLRGRLLKLEELDYVAIFTLHHTITDGWSMSIFIKEMAALYQAYLNDTPSDLPEPEVQYGDYAIWQREWLQGENLEKQIAFWKEYLGENPAVLELPTDRPRPAVQTFNGRTLKMLLPAELTGRLNAFSQKEGITLFMTLLTAFQTLMQRYSGQDQILTGTPVANRTQVVTEKLIGFFVNTLVLKTDFSLVQDFRSLLRQVREKTLQAFAHQDLPFEQLVEALHVERSMSHSPLFQTAFILQNISGEKLELPGLTLEPFEAENTIAKYDLTLTAAEIADGIECQFEYNTDLFDAATIQRWMGHFESILTSMVATPKALWYRTDFLSAAEKQNLLQTWNDSAVDLPDPHTFNAVYESLAARASDQPAVQLDDQVLTYNQLNKKANQLAHYLLRQGLEPEQVVGISLPRSTDIAVAILGILKAGGAFLAIEPTYPAERISYIMQDSALRYLITSESMQAIFAGQDVRFIYPDRDAETIANFPDSSPAVTVDENQLAYLIYTSGSTGKPKGTMLQHKGMVNLSRAQRQAFSITADSRILQFASLSFDASVWETVMALLNGATLVFAHQEQVTSGQELVKLLDRQSITTITLPPSVLAVMPQQELPALKTIITAGEKCTTDLVHRWGRDRQFVNAYGPTETTVCASMYETSVDDEFEPPIGRPIDNFQLYVLDKNWEITPVGVPGELCVAGTGLARGYWQRPELTAEKFIPNPFSKDPGQRLYRTGDLVRWLPSGQIEFLGRIDFQVKIRGFRIEPGEIEARLTAHPEIQDVSVQALDDGSGSQRLVAYYVSKNGTQLDSDQLKEFVKKQLPEYMVPGLFLHLTEMPLTNSGKVDRKALPQPEFSRESLKTEFVAPRNETEEKLAAIVRELLNIDQVGVDDSFFDLGGHSLLATKFMARILDAFDVEYPLRHLFEQPTIAAIAAYLPELQATAQAQPGERITAQPAEENMEALLAELDGMSDEEAAALLEAELNKEKDTDKSDG